MLINGKAFDGSFDYEFTDFQLELCTGTTNTSCITQFRPVVFPDAQIVYKLVLVLHKEHLCCFLTGTFALFVAGRLDSFDGISIFVAMTDLKSTTLLCWLFQKIQAQTFALDDDFTFTLVNAADVRLDLFHYVVSYEDVTMQVSIFGIGTTKHCGPISNIDLVYFIWETFLRFSYKRYAMALSPRGGSALPQLPFLNHYRVVSYAWKNSANCDACVEHHQDVFHPFHACELSDDWKCKICKRQPPSLAD
jgi:hypothetical protein